MVKATLWKTGLAALAAAAVTTAAQAQTTQVSVYGILDTGVEHLSNVNAAGDSLTRMPNLTGTVPSRLGFRGTEDLGGGLSAVFTLEGGLNVDTGTSGQGGRMFGRQSWVGLASRELGTLTFGRIYTMTTLALMSDTLGPSLYSLSSLDPYLANARTDNSVGYLGRFGAMTVGATYSLGRDAAGVAGVPNPAATLCAGESAADSRACRAWSAMLKYDTDTWGLALSHEELRGGPGETLGLVSSGHKDRRAIANGWAKFGGLRVNAGVLNRRRDAATAQDSNLWFVGASYSPLAQLSVAAEFHRLDLKASPDDTDLLVLRAVYELSRRTAVYAMWGYSKNGGMAARSVSAGGTVGAGMNQTGLMAGVRHSF